MSATLYSADASHWYGVNGVPMHTVPSARGEPRPTTLRDARKLGLLPSVTNILGVIAKPALTGWLQEQAVLAALTLPRQEGESTDAFAKRVVEDSMTSRDGAADFGTRFHHGAQLIANGGTPDPMCPEIPWLLHYRHWFETNVAHVIWAEKTLVHAGEGYAGTADLLIEHKTCGLVLVDIKTQGINPRRGLNIHSTWGYQLAAYRLALGQPMHCLNLVVNSKNPEAPTEHPWSENEMKEGEAAFQAARRLWIIEKQYNPVANKVGHE